MARWEPDAEDRLRRAAVALFIERGYDAVTVSDIAGRAGLTRRSFFRYFPDKREVLFAGSGRFVGEIQRRLDSAAPDEPIQDALVRVLAEAGTALVSDRAGQQERRAIIASSPELQERDRTKNAQIATAIADSMTRRGTASADADFLGAICSDAFRFAYDRALSGDRRLEFSVYLSEAVRLIESFLVPLATGACMRKDVS